MHGVVSVRRWLFRLATVGKSIVNINDFCVAGSEVGWTRIGGEPAYDSLDTACVIKMPRVQEADL